VTTKLTLVRFFKYVIVGVSTFIFDLVLLSIFIDIFLWNYVLATGAAFTIAISVNYFFSRRYVFKETLRSFYAGYVAFMVIASIGIGIAMLGMALMVGVFNFHILDSRIIIAGVVGIWNYLINLYFNFKVADKHLKIQ
jgi:putative flippase GtrA